MNSIGPSAARRVDRPTRLQCEAQRLVAHLARGQQAVADGLQRLLDTARAGVPASRLAEAWTFALAEHGLTKPSRLGYSIGIGYPPDWGERTMSLRPGDRTVLQPGMTFHFMTGLWTDEMGLEITESVVITEGAPELLASVPRKLFVKD